LCECQSASKNECGGSGIARRSDRRIAKRNHHKGLLAPFYQSNAMAVRKAARVLLAIQMLN
jgi:hypothetical protein